MANIISREELEHKVRFIEQEITYAACRGTGLVPTDEDRVYIMSLADELKRLSGGLNCVMWDKKGRPSIMVNIFCDEQARLSYLSNTGTVIANDPDRKVHPAFVVDGEHIAGFAVQKYPWCRYNGVNYDVSLYRMDTAYSVSLNGALSNVDTTNTGTALSDGVHMHVITLAEMAYISLLGVRNGFQPRGNDSYGKSSQKTDEYGEPGGYDYGDGKLYQIKTGTGPTSWRHDGTIFGISELRGNQLCWINGVKLMNGKIYIFKDNNAAGETRVAADFAITNVSTDGTDAAKWVSIMPDGAYVGAGADGCLGYDYTSEKGDSKPCQIVTSLTPQTSDEEGYMSTALKSLEAAEGVDIPDIMRQLTLAGDLSEQILGTFLGRTNGERGCLAGGYCSYGSNAGLGYRYFNYSPATTSTYFVSRSATLIRGM